jgi:sugar phosphate permease
MAGDQENDVHMVCPLQIGNLQALAQFLSNASKSLSGTLADILSPSRMIIFGTLLTTLNKPMFAMSGYIYATFGTVITLYWVTAGTDSRA